jgi:squalene-associated FAD-dependent desaturase
MGVGLPGESTSPSAGTTLVVGAGWAGLAAAVGLVEAGRRVRLIDAAPQPGGRARSQMLELGGSVVEVDNGQHLLIGAYRSTLALIARVGVAPGAVLARTRLRLRGPDGLDLRAAALPAPLHLAWALLTARGLPWSERRAMMRAMAALRQDGPDATPQGMTVADWYALHRQPAGLVRRIWTPLCVGALNTPPGRACARAFAQVLHDTLLGRAADSDFLLPRGTLGDVLPRPATAWLAARGTKLELRTAARALVRIEAAGWRLETDRGPIDAEQVVLAVPPFQAARLLADAAGPALLAALDRFEHEPIATVWLGWRQVVALPDAVMLDDRPEAGEYGQWLFGRHAPPGSPIRTLGGVVVSAAGRSTERPAELAAAIARQVAAQRSLPLADHARSIVDKRATIRCAPDRPRIDVDALAHDCPGVALAGDWIWHRYPATIESAVRAGDAAAAWLLGAAAGSCSPAVVGSGTIATRSGRPTG